MPGILRAVATDFDGTLTDDGRRPDERVLAALARIRARGGLVLLVTGRILAELRAVFPDVDDHVDAIVAENGAVLWTEGRSRLLAPPVDPALAEALAARGVPVRRGEVLLACHGRDAAAVLEEIHRLGLDAQIMWNRNEAMVLPAGVSKGTGAFEAFGEQRVSHHSAIGIGDAENDLALLEVCEVGVAVGNAVPSVKRRADLVLDEDAGAGVARLLDGPVLAGRTPVFSRRWRLTLGTDAGGLPVTLPASQLNLLVCGAPGLGKSHFAGLVAERLIGLGYCVLVIDPEGDHVGLTRLRGVAGVDARGGLPAPERVAALFTQRFTSVVLDLSGVADDVASQYLADLHPLVHEQRARHGVPHWVVDDEAHRTSPPACTGNPADAYGWGHCLVTYQPAGLRETTLDTLDAVVVVPGHDVREPALLDVLRRVSGAEPARLSPLLAAAHPGAALLVAAPRVAASAWFTVATRATPHLRHWHKYTAQHLPAERAFFARDGRDVVVAAAANLTELGDLLATCSDDVLAHHVAGSDFSRWIRDVFHDDRLADAVARVERDARAGHVEVSLSRQLLLAALHERTGL